MVSAVSVPALSAFLRGEQNGPARLNSAPCPPIEKRQSTGCQKPPYVIQQYPAQNLDRMP